MAQNLSSFAVVIGALRVNIFLLKIVGLSCTINIEKIMGDHLG